VIFVSTVPEPAPKARRSLHRRRLTRAGFFFGNWMSKEHEEDAVQHHHYR
jgi:hypothetical protein